MAHPAARQQLEFLADGLTLLGIFAVNLGLSIVTLGIYYFWAKARTRRYLYSQTAFAGDRFAYHATGQEFFIGWLKAMCILAPVMAIEFAIQFKLGRHGVLARTAPGLFLYPALGFLVPVVMVGTWRFRLARTSWRGIRFSFRGRASEFLGVFWVGVALTIATLGFYAPAFPFRIRRYFANHTYFGNSHFEFNAEIGEVVGPAIVSYLLMIPTLGLSLIWYRAWKERYAWEHTSLQGVPFKSSLSFSDLFGLYLTNALLLLVTLGIALPWVLIRSRRLHFSRLVPTGPLALDTLVQQAQAKASGLGEELGDILDLGFLDLDLGL